MIGFKKHYCGAYYFPKWLNKILSFGINEACYIHDFDYTKRNRRKITSDLVFFKNIIKISLVNILKGVYGLLLAPIYLLFVLTFGRISWGSNNQ